MGGPATSAKEDIYREMGKAPNTIFSFQCLLPEAFQVPLGLRQQVWTYGEAIWGIGMGFAARQTGLQPQCLTPKTESSPVMW